MSKIEDGGLAKHITEEYAERCPDFSPGCINCVAWKAYETLIADGPISEAEAAMAMHWLDRYAVGIDSYPQFDRILSARSAPRESGR